MLYCSRSVACPVLVVGIGSKAFLKESRQVWRLLLLIDLSPRHHFKVTEKKKKIFFILFLNCCVVISGFFCWPANRDNSEQNHFSHSLGVT